ncbi:spore germination protein [Domibacillus indicus]|uniref:GerAB/ArcD/ProY family transporter n=1 Tax=Domibacillus indicus TaxID=1437523 RepID=UPI002040D727|nr:GerAB/ArcD/ProY family transporter [Domibacillus indicus]MCM3790503.1 spore germination protein [Domibacillus indicus]
MERAKISGIQFFLLLFMFEMGTAVVVGHMIAAKKDAWLSLLLGMGGGLVLFLVSYGLFRYYPSLPLTAYARKIFGPYIGWIVGLLYTIFFLYVSARNVREFSEVLITATMPEIPLLVVAMLFVFTICYVLYLGIEVFARTAEILGVFLIFIGIIGNLFVYVTGTVDPNNLKPVLEYGWKPILETAFYSPAFLIFPFGEAFVFAMLFPYLNRADAVKKIGVASLIISGLILSYNAALNVAVLGVSEVLRSPFPLLATVGKINFLEFIQRLDALVVVTLLITVFFKAGIYLYCSVIGMVDLFRLKNHQQMIFPAGLILAFLSVMMAEDMAEHTEEGATVYILYAAIPLLIILPVVMLLIAFIRHRLNK